MSGFEFVLTLVPDTAIAPDGDIQLHCTGHEPPLLLGEWPATLTEEDEAAYRAAVTAAVNAHRLRHCEEASG